MSDPTFILQEPPLEGAAPAGTMLTAAQWAQAHGVVPRSVRRYLAAGKLPGAERQADGSWLIPADAQPTHKGGQGTVARQEATTAVDRPARGRQAAPEASLAALLDAQPAWLDLDTAARLMGLDPAILVRNRERFGVERLGDLDPRTRRRAWVVPQATVRTVAGLR